MDCHYCHGKDTYQEVKTRYFSPSAPRAFFVGNLPVFECTQCGEQDLSNATMDVLDAIRGGEGRPVAFTTIPVYDHDNLTGYPKVAASISFRSYVSYQYKDIDAIPALVSGISHQEYNYNPVVVVKLGWQRPTIQHTIMSGEFARLNSPV